MKINKAAMFGLDARIALAIFGALSVISGAALYSAIQHSKAVALLAELNEVGKALEQYYLDTGSDLSPVGSSSPDSDYRQTVDFITDPGVTGWDGPYLVYEGDVSPNEEFLIYPKGSHIHVVSAQSGSWDVWSDALCVSDDDCYMWVMFNVLDDNLASIVEKLDDIVDDEDGGSLGTIRYPSTLKAVYLKYAPNF